MNTRYVIGVGNYSMADDGIGLQIIEYIAKNDLNKDFEVIDLAENGVNLLHYLESGAEKILIIDTVLAGKIASAGDMLFFYPDEVKTQKTDKIISTHEGDVLRIIELAKDLGYPIPPIKFMGIVPEKVHPEMQLSNTLKERLETYAQMAINEIHEQWKD